MSGRTFEAEIFTAGGGGRALEVPFDVRAEFGQARAPVRVRINGYEFTTTTAVYGGRYLIGLNKGVRAGAGVDAGDRVEVEVELDSRERTVTVPADLAAALTEADAQAEFDALSFTHRREQVEAIEGAKRPETRARRVAKAVATAATTREGGAPK